MKVGVDRFKEIENDMSKIRLLSHVILLYCGCEKTGGGAALCCCIRIQDGLRENIHCRVEIGTTTASSLLCNIFHPPCILSPIHLFNLLSHLLISCCVLEGRFDGRSL